MTSCPCCSAGARELCSRLLHHTQRKRQPQWGWCGADVGLGEAATRILPQSEEPLGSPAAATTVKDKEGEDGAPWVSPGLEQREGQGCAWERLPGPGHVTGRKRFLPHSCLTVLVPAPALLLPLPRAPSTSEDGTHQAPPHQEDGSCSPCSCQDQTSSCAGHQVRNTWLCWGATAMSQRSWLALAWGWQLPGCATSHLCCPQAQ